MKLKVNDTFDSIVSEGVLAGRPAYFIRLNGSGKKTSVKKLVKKVQKEAMSHTVVLIGEPMAYDATTELVTSIIRLGWIVQIETDGINAPKDFPFLPPDKGFKAGLVIVCSPRTKKIHPEIARCASCFKYSIDSTKEVCKDGLPRVTFKPPRDRFSTIMLRPANEASISKTKELSLQYGFYMCYPWHKHI